MAFLLALGAPLFAQFAPNRYAVLLQDQPVSERFAGRARLATADARAYRQQVQRRQQALRQTLETRGVRVVGSASTLVNALFVVAPPDQAASLRSTPGVAGVVRMRLGKKNINRATELTKIKDAWATTGVGGMANAGKGIKIGIIDTGIDQTHPAFQDSTLSMPAGYPLCTDGHPEDCAFTNSKVIVARSYVRAIAVGGYNADGSMKTLDPATSRPDDYSPRDRDGHGTAVASIAAGNTATGPAATITGAAPKAYLGSYKIYGSPGVNDAPPEDVIIQAIDDAVNDDMDVVNLSTGLSAITGALDTGAVCGNDAGKPCDLTAWAFEEAARQGVVVVVSAGNSGTDRYTLVWPVYNSITSPAIAPSVIAVGATMNSHVLLPTVSVLASAAPANLKNISALPSDSYPTPLGGYLAGSLNAPLIDVATLGDATACTSFGTGSLKGALALVQRASTGSTSCSAYKQATNVQNAGAFGLIMYNTSDTRAWDANGSALENVYDFLGPAVAISNADGIALKTWLAANPGSSAAIDLSGREQASSQSNQLASYTSLGPAMASNPTCSGCAAPLVKPDLVATGGGDSFLGADVSDPNLTGPPAMYMAAQSYDPAGEIYSANGFGAADGTSFASPLTAGAAALVKQAHPSYTAAQIRSALVNTADATAVTITDFNDPIDIRGTGAGLLKASAATAVTITAEPVSVAFSVMQPGGALAGSQTFTLTNNSAADVSLTLSVAPQTAASATVSLDATSFTLAKNGGARVITASLSGSNPGKGYYSGNINIGGAGVSLHVPYQFLVAAGAVGSTGSIFPVFGSYYYEAVTGQDIGAVGIQLLDPAGVAVPNSPVTFRVNQNGATLRSATGAVACTPDSSTTTVTCNTDNYGIAYVDVVAGPVGSSQLDVTAEGVFAVTIDLYARPRPTIGGIGDAAKGLTTVAPGSYVSIYGTNMSDYVNQASTTRLPLSLEQVTVSFDVPSAGISVPASFAYVSPTQLNVQVPWELQGLPAGTKAKVKVTLKQYENSNVFDVAIADASPSFFECGSNNVCALIANTATVIFPTAPAKKGAILQLYANGLGPVNSGPASADPATGIVWMKEKPTITIGGIAADVSYWGLAPGFPGLYQLNVTVPSDVASGIQPVQLTVSGKTATSGLPIQ